ncbi:MAG: lysylphosphatidylglycerol synthetase family protein, partial [Chitinophagaceae bacterium]
MYIMTQAGMYRSSFAALGLRLKWINGCILFLKRNLMSVFLPAGGVSALAYTPSQIRKSGYTQMQIHRASGLFGFAGLATVFIAGVPVIIYTFFTSGEIYNSIVALVILSAVLAGLFIAARSFRSKGRLFQWIDRKFPSVASFINELFATDVSIPKFSGTIAYSLGVELCGMLHMYIAMKAFGLPASFGAAAAAYIIAVLMMIISPFLRGLGAVEISMVFVLERYGYTATQAFSVTILYRVFEFWLPLLAGIVSFAWKGRQLFLRIFPALLTFSLGLINIISVVTPPLLSRIHLLRVYVPLATIQASNMLVVFIGLSLIVTAAFLFRGLRTAWLVALSLSLVSIVGHLLKAFDYEEATIAAINFVVLASTASQYRISNGKRWMLPAFKTAVISFAAVLLFAFTSFYFIDKKHFGVDFTSQQAFMHVLRSLLLFDDETLTPVTKFGHEFLLIVKILGFLNWTFFLVSLFRSSKQRIVEPAE